jgi:hypothetical protein
MRARALCQLYLFLSSRVVEETKTLSYIFHKVPMRARATDTLPPVNIPTGLLPILHTT